jgi:hypothetical protein
VTNLLLVGVHDLLQWNAEFLAERLELLEVLCVLALVLDLELDACDVSALNRWSSNLCDWDCMVAAPLRVVMVFAVL